MADGQASVRSNGTAVTEINGALEGGAIPVKLIGLGGLTLVDLFAVLAESALGDDDSLGPGLVRQPPRMPRLAPALSESAWVAVFPGAHHGARLALAAGLLQIHDFWDASHDAAQRADDLGERNFSAYWHGIAHRREPDASNAAYWFRKVGRHPVSAALTAAARPLLDRHGDTTLTGRLIGGNGWNASAMIDLCTQAPPGSADETVARQLQRLEMWLLLEATVAPLLPPSRS